MFNFVNKRGRKIILTEDEYINNFSGRGFLVKSVESTGSV